MIHVFAHLGAPPAQSCPKSVVVKDLGAPAPLPGVKPPPDADKEPEPAAPGPVERAGWFKWAAGGLAVYAGLKVLGWL